MEKTKNQKICAVIPARGGSKGIPRKNIKQLCGKPLVAYAIENALMTPSIDRVFVSTDDHEIAKISKIYGAEIIQRPDELSGDKASSESALLHALDYLEKVEHYTPELIVFLQCTSPLTSSKDIEGAIKKLIHEKADSLVSVTKFHYYLWKNNKNCNAVGINHDKSTRKMRQDQEEQYLENGAIYLMRVEGFKRASHRFFGKTSIYEMPKERCLEIDEPADMLIAEAMIGAQRKCALLKNETIRAIILDFDGVFTDNRVMVFQDGKEAVICSRADGWGLSCLKRTGIPILVISTEENPVVDARCKKLGIECIQGRKSKIKDLKSWLNRRNIKSSEVVYVGNDVNDAECMAFAGIAVAVADAHPKAKNLAKYVLGMKGGKGAIRELSDLIMAEDNWD